MIQSWFECRVRFTKVDQNGSERAVTETYVLDAVSFTDAEARLILQMQQRIKGEFAVTDIRRSKISAVFAFDKGEWWFRATINVVTIDEEAGKEKKVKAYYLLNADDMKEALMRLHESLTSLIVPYMVSSLSISMIADIFPYEVMNIPAPDNLRSFDEIFAERKKSDDFA